MDFQISLYSIQLDSVDFLPPEKIKKKEKYRIKSIINSFLNYKYVLMNRFQCFNLDKYTIDHLAANIRSKQNKHRNRSIKIDWCSVYLTGLVNVETIIDVNSHLFTVYSVSLHVNRVSRRMMRINFRMVCEIFQFGTQYLVKTGRIVQQEKFRKPKWLSKRIIIKVNLKRLIHRKLTHFILKLADWNSNYSTKKHWNE